MCVDCCCPIVAETDETEEYLWIVDGIIVKVQCNEWDTGTSVGVFSTKVCNEEREGCISIDQKCLPTYLLRDQFIYA